MPRLNQGGVISLDPELLRVAGAVMEVAGKIRRVPAYNDMPEITTKCWCYVVLEEELLINMNTSPFKL